MGAFWAVLGIVVLAAGFLDVFLTALNYDESGFLAIRLCTLQWRCLRVITRRLSRQWRSAALRQVTGLNIILSIVIWLGSIILGYGLIYYSQMFGANFQYDGRGLSTPIRNYGDVLRSRVIPANACCFLSLVRSACRSRRVNVHLNGFAARW